MTRPDRPRQFLDALSGQDGTQALRTPYQVPPVYPDASLGVLPESRPATRTSRVQVVVPKLPVVDPQLLAELAEPLRPLAGPPRQPGRAPVPPTQRPPARRTTALAAGGVPAVQYNQQVAPTRQQAASAGHYQGPVPLAVAPAAASTYNAPMTYAAPMTYTAPQWSAFPPGATPIQAPGLSRRPSTPPNAIGSPNRPATPPNATGRSRSGQFTNATPRKKTGWVQTTLFLIIFVLIFSGLGTRLLDLIQQLFQR